MGEDEQFSTITGLNVSIAASKTSEPSAWKEHDVSRVTTGEFGLPHAAERKYESSRVEPSCEKINQSKFILPSNKDLLSDGMTIMQDEPSSSTTRS